MLVDKDFLTCLQIGVVAVLPSNEKPGLKRFMDVDFNMEISE